MFNFWSRYCPLKIVDWIEVSNVKDAKSVVAAVKQQKRTFHTVVYCGSVDAFPQDIQQVLVPAGAVSVMAPVKVNGGMQFQLFMRHDDGTEELKAITDFGVIFEEVK